MTHARVDEIHEGTLAGVVRAPDMCRLTILAQNTQVDLAVPVDVPLSLLIPGIVDMIAAHRTTNAFDDRDEQLEPTEWVLARVGRPPLSSTLSLGENGIRDGELLMLESAAKTAPPPLFDDIMYSVAQADGEHYRRWTPELARTMGSVIAALATVAGCFGLLWGTSGDADVIGAVSALFFALVLLIAGTVTSRVYGDVRSAMVLCGCALPLAFTAGVAFVPDDFGWAHVLLGTAIAGAAAIVALRVSGVGQLLFTAVAGIALFTAPAALVGLLTEHPARAIGAVVAAAALVALAMGPRISMLLAKLPLPNVPAPGTSIDPMEDDPNEPAMPTFTALESRAERAQLYLTGVILATTIVTAGGALLATDFYSDGGIYWPGTALAIICGVVLMFRGRTFAAAEQATTLIAGGAFILLALLVGASFVTEWPLAVFGAAIALAVAALVLGIIAPAQTASPPVRRAIELFEYACVAAVIPLVCWVANLYELMRGL